MAANRTVKVGAGLLPLVAATCLIACTDGTPTGHRFSGYSMGTSFAVEIADAEVGDRQKLENGVVAVLSDIENRLSTYLPSSGLSRLNESRELGWQTIGRTLCLELEAALRLAGLTDGAFDPTVGPLVDLWGFGADGIILAPPPADAIDKRLSTVGYRHLELDCDRPAARKREPTLSIDLSGYAKGYAVDEIAAFLESLGAENFLVEVGGELKLRGSNAEEKPWSIAIERPPPRDRSVQSVMRLSDTAVATSGDYRNFFEYEGRRYSHTIDPRTGRPVDHSLAAVTVLADSAAYADAIATALLVLGPDAGMEFAERERVAALFLLRDGDEVSERRSSRFAQFPGLNPTAGPSRD